MIDCRDDVVRLLGRLERVLREVREQPELIKRVMAVRAGCLESDIDALEDEVREAIGVIDVMQYEGEVCDLDLSDCEHCDAVKEALDGLGAIEDCYQVEVLERAIKASDCFDSNLEGLNSMLQEAGKDWYVIHQDTKQQLRDVLTVILDE